MTFLPRASCVRFRHFYTKLVAEHPASCISIADHLSGGFLTKVRLMMHELSKERIAVPSVSAGVQDVLMPDRINCLGGRQWLIRMPHF